jgi:hypothetical protein
LQKKSRAPSHPIQEQAKSIDRSSTMRSSREVRRRTVQGTFRLCLTVNNRRSGIVKKHGRLFFLLIIWLCYMFFRANPLDVRASLIDPKTLVPIYILRKKRKNHSPTVTKVFSQFYRTRKESHLQRKHSQARELPSYLVATVPECEISFAPPPVSVPAPTHEISFMLPPIICPFYPLNFTRKGGVHS